MLKSRYRRILFFFASILTSEIFWDLILPRIGLAKWSNRTRNERVRNIAVRYRSLAVQMGGVLIKVGQFLSARVDVLPSAATDVLAGLQDEVPSESFDDIREVVETEFSLPILDKFVEFDAKPLAAASLGQAHLAKLRITAEQAVAYGVKVPSGEMAEWIDYSVVVKVQRPNIEAIIATDLAAVKTVGGWIKRYPPIRKRVNIQGLLAEFSRGLYEEIDYLAEGKNAETFAANFLNDPGVLVPKVVWTHTTKRVLTLEDVRAIKITDYEEISAAGIDRTEVATRLLNNYLKQIFEDGFFHADPHPGNLFVKPLKKLDGDKLGSNEWILTFIDFGMVGRMRPEIKLGLRELLVGVALQDTARVIKAYQILGILLPGADTELLEKAESAMFERFWGKGMDELAQIKMEEIHDFAYQFRDILYDMPFQLPQDLIFLGRAVGILSGMCIGLDPQINVFEQLTPFTQKIIKEEAQHDWGYWVKEVGDYARRLISLPVRADALISRLERGELKVRDPQLSENIKRLEKTISKLASGIIFAALLIASILVSPADQLILIWTLRIASLIALLWTIIS
ncbi:MAG: AarF/ABC1/UbiB kinase family protein [Anaerolineae bacterium]|nr:AarF/ABC1/UbiB kinase family protein [Anaerolineae bacterium]